MAKGLNITTRAVEKAIFLLKEEGRLKRDGGKKEGFWHIIPKKDLPVEDESSVKSSVKSSEKILQKIHANSKITISEMAKGLNNTTRTVEKAIFLLKEEGRLKRIGGKKEGFWHIIPKEALSVEDESSVKD